MIEPRVGSASPWGPIQIVEELAPGVWSVATAGHGGLKLSPERVKRLPDICRATGYSGGGWFEEDCDWAIPALQFADVRQAMSISHADAERIVTAWQSDEIKAAFGISR